MRQLGAQGGIAITASHNPPEWNALKFVDGDGLFLSAARGRELLDIYHQGDYAKAKGADQRTPERVADAVERHVKAVLDGVGALPSGRRLRVVVDSGGGAASVAAPRLVEALGAVVSAIHLAEHARGKRLLKKRFLLLYARCSNLYALRSMLYALSSLLYANSLTPFHLSFIRSNNGMSDFSFTCLTRGAHPCLSPRNAS